jgi:hypothetical protein
VTVIFTLEALRAKHGDCLLLHYGSADAPRFALIDGGPAGVWQESLRPRLEALRLARHPGGTLEIPLVMVSHIDDDHVNGLLRLTRELVQHQEDGAKPPYRIGSLWHNGFDDLLGNQPDELLRPAAAAMIGAADLTDQPPELPAEVLRRHPGALVLASVAQGRQLRLDAERLGLAVNAPGGTGGLLIAGDGEPVPFDDGLELTLIGPSRKRLLDLQEEWDEFLEKKGLGQVEPVEAAAFTDRSVFNLASVVVLARTGEPDGPTLLLTGDARGDDVLEGLAAAGLLEDGGTLHVDLLKVPHHGSDRNVDTGFFRTVTADHYVISGDGRHGNPEPATFEMLLGARRDDDRPYTLHLTYSPEEMIDGYPAAEAREMLAREREAGREVEVVTGGVGERGVMVELGEVLPEP